MSALGFHVWNPAGRLPTVVHDTFLQAWAEADRLKRAHPGQRFVVMAPIQDMSGIGYALGWSEGRQEGLAQAHREIMKTEAAADRAMDQAHDLRRQLRRADPVLTKHRDFQAIVADALLWFDGFTAAFTHRESWEQPRVPERDKLRELNSALQALDRSSSGNDADLDDEIPF